MLLSILIPTINGREGEYERLVGHLHAQLDCIDNVEVLFYKDNKEITIGAKRQRLYEAAKGVYSVQIDDDDLVAPDYIQKVLEALQANPDCVCYLEHITYSGVPKTSCHSNRWADWGHTHAGYDYIRTPYFKDVIKTEYCLQVGVNDLRYAEDIDFARRLKASGLIKDEYFINEFMYFYSYAHMNEQQMKVRYGIK